MEEILPRDVVSNLSVCHLSQVLSSTLPRRYQLPESCSQPVASLRELILTGSRSQDLYESIESPFENAYHSDPIDTDYLYDVCCPCSVGPRNDPATHIVIDTSATKPGYLRLEHIPEVVPGEGSSDECEFRSYCGLDIETERTEKTRTYISMTSFKERLAELLAKPFRSGCRAEVTLAGPAVSVNYSFDGNTGPTAKTEWTLAIQGKAWPSVAEEWLTRPRPSGWLSSSTLQDIENNGCYFVQVPHRASLHPDIEWRFSFTYAESRLTRRLSDIQRRCFIALKRAVCVSIEASSVISSFCLKNILFWKLDQIPGEVWGNPWTGLGTCFLALLDELIHCLANHNIPHYFIPANNLIGHRTRETIRTVLKQLILIRQNPVHGHFVRVASISANTAPRVGLIQDFMKSDRVRQTFADFVVCFFKLYVRTLTIAALGGLDAGEDFSAIIRDVHLVDSDFFRECLDMFQIPDDIEEDDFLEIRVRTSINGAWYCFVYLLHNENESMYQDKMSVVKCILEKAKSLAEARARSNHFQVLVRTLYTLFQHKRENHHEALGAAREVISLWSPNLALCRMEGGKGLYWGSVFFSNHLSVAFHASLHPLITKFKTAAGIPISAPCIAYHTVFQCSLDTHLEDKAREILRLFKEHGERVDELEAIETQIITLYVLAQDQQKVGDYTGALITYGNIVDAKNIYDIDFTSDKEFCMRQLSNNA